MGLAKDELHKLRHPSETSRFYLTMFVLVPLGFVVATLTIATFGTILLLAPIILFIIWFFLRVTVASWMNNLIQVSDNSFPIAQRAIREAKDRFGYKGKVEAYVFEEGSYNAKILPLLGTKFLLLHSELMKKENSEDELRFIIGRFIGAAAAKHYRFGWLQFFISSIERLFIFNLLLYPFERATKLSGDRMGLYMIDGDVSVAVISMVKMTIGSDLAYQVNIRAYVAQGLQYNGSFFSWFARAFSPFPHHCKRVSELIDFAKERYPEKVPTALDVAPDS